MNWCIIMLLTLFEACSGTAGKTRNSSVEYFFYGAEAIRARIQTSCKVVGIKDGDTFVLLMNGKEQVIRLAHIDCPEKKQPFGSRAKQFASDACFGKQVTLVHDNKYDRNKRLIAEVILDDGRNLNKELVKNGLAWHFKRYSDNKEYAALETAARLQQKGLWAEAAPVAPWNWRHRKRSL